ncbi:MAG: Gfo/Idh/MocA family oxidoreductase [bacterium]|jgi:predicted dehydrogenase
MADKKVTRRDFVENTTRAALAAAFVAPKFPSIVPRHVLGGPGFQAPSDTLNFAVVGFGGMGSGNANVLAQVENMVAVCDVDLAFADSNVASKEKNRDGSPNAPGVKLREQFNKAKKYTDFREMLDKSKDIDAVIIATADHNHAVIAKAAMQAGKHVYVQKPLTYSVHEARVLGKLAKDNPKLATQMGNQGHSRDGTRSIVEWVQAGVLGDVKEVHVWTNRPVGYWPQAVSRPRQPNANVPAGFGKNFSQGAINNVTAYQLATAQYSMPDGLRWDLYLGGVPEDVPYHPIYHPFNWRGWTDFGVGALGDMGAHLIDQPYWALGLTQPTAIEASASPWGTEPIVPRPTSGPTTKPCTYPMATTVTYDFPARGNKPAVRMYWYDGGILPPRPAMLPDNVQMNPDGGVLFVGTKGVLMHETYGDNPKIYPESAAQAATKVAKSIVRIETSHEVNWANAAKGKGTTSSPFEYAANLTETMCLGIVALKTGVGRKLVYDAASMTVTNIPEANQYLTRNYRKGWEV